MADNGVMDLIIRAAWLTSWASPGVIPRVGGGGIDVAEIESLVSDTQDAFDAALVGGLSYILYNWQLTFNSCFGVGIQLNAMGIDGPVVDLFALPALYAANLLLIADLSYKHMIVNMQRVYTA